MAKPKVEHLVEVVGNIIQVYTNNLSRVSPEIMEIEGVNFVITGTLPLSAYIDPRYEVEEVAQEIRALLLAEVPSVFREE